MKRILFFLCILMLWNRCTTPWAAQTSDTYYAPSSAAPALPVTGSNRVILHNLNIGAEVSALFWR